MSLLTGRQRRALTTGERTIMTSFSAASGTCGPSATRLIVDALATFRLTKLVIDDQIAQPVRDRLWARFPPETTKIGYLSTCPWCASFWAGLAVAAGRRLAPRLTAVVVEALAASAVTGLAYDHIPDQQ